MNITRRDAVELVAAVVTGTEQAGLSGLYSSSTRASSIIAR